MNNILLINPPYVNQANSKAHLPVQMKPPLGLLYLAAMLQKNNFHVNIIDAPAKKYEVPDIQKRILRLHPDLIGFYTTSFSLPAIFNLISFIKNRTRAYTVIGGPHVTHHPSSVEELSADYGMIGDCEKSFINLLKTIKNKKKLQGIPGLIYKDNKDFRITKKASLKYLNDLPFPARELVDSEDYYTPLFDGNKVTSLITSRGCPGNCVFCALLDKGTYTTRSPENVVKEMEMLERTGYHYIEIQDDFFTLDNKRVKKICDLMLDKNLKIKWGCETKINSVNKELLDLMKKAGCMNIKYGIESGSERIRTQVINKPLDNNKITSMMDYSKKIGLDTVAYFTFGNPTETKDEIEKTIKLAKKLNPDYVSFHLLTPLPGSRLFDIALKEKKIGSDVWLKTQQTGEIPFYYPDTISLDDLITLRKKAYNRFYFRPSRLIKEIHNLKSIKGIYLRIKCGLIVLKS